MVNIFLNLLFVFSLLLFQIQVLLGVSINFKANLVARNTGNCISGHQISKIFWGSIPPDDPPTHAYSATHIACKHDCLWGKKEGEGSVYSLPPLSSPKDSRVYRLLHTWPSAIAIRHTPNILSHRKVLFQEMPPPRENP